MMLINTRSDGFLSLGIENIVTDGFKWRKLIFYEIDRMNYDYEITLNLSAIRKALAGAKSSYVLYSTEHGYHLAGLSPVNNIVYAYAFKDLDMDLKGNYSGSVLRVNKRPHEIQKLYDYNFDYVMCDIIFKMYKIKLNIKQTNIANINIEKWKSVFHLYTNKFLAHRLPSFQRAGVTPNRKVIDTRTMKVVPVRCYNPHLLNGNCHNGSLNTDKPLTRDHRVIEIDADTGQILTINGRNIANKQDGGRQLQI